MNSLKYKYKPKKQEYYNKVANISDTLTMLLLNGYIDLQTNYKNLGL